jgi:dTDP-4-dehydrorhamnose 3,5-epimerase
MKVTHTPISEVIVFEPQVFNDSRGYFLETYQEQKYREAGVPKSFVQDNQSYSIGNVLRGLHFQMHHPQGKLVRVTQGSVFELSICELVRLPSASGMERFCRLKIESRCTFQKILPTVFASNDRSYK